MTAVWKAAIPPTLCAIFLCMLYIQYAVAQQVCPLHRLFRSESSFFLYQRLLIDER